MEKNKTETQIKSYFAGELNNLQRKNFVTELGHDQELQKAVFIYAMQNEKEVTPENEAIRSRIVAIKEKIKPLSEAQLNWWDHIRFTILEWPTSLKWLSVIILLNVIVLFGWVNINIESRDDLIQNYSPIAYCPGIAGEGRNIADDIYKRASDFYCKVELGGLDSLKAVAASCPEFCIADYYLAHEQLKNAQYQEAENGFIDFINRREELALTNFKPNIKELELNLYLAQLGQKSQRKKAIENLESFSIDLSVPSNIRTDVGTLVSELKHPLRFLKISISQQRQPQK